MIKRTSLILIFFLSQLYYAAAQEKHDAAVSILKSANLYKICLFAIWPEKNIQSKPFTIQVVGELPDENIISYSVDQTYYGRPIIVKKIKKVSEIKDSHVLFITSSMIDKLDSIRVHVKNKPILTAADTEGFAEKGVMVNFYVKENKIKFELNRREIIDSPIKISPEIFAFGRNVN